MQGQPTWMNCKAKACAPSARASASPIYEEEQTRFADDFGKMARQTAAEDAARDGAAARPVEKNKP